MTNTDTDAETDSLRGYLFVTILGYLPHDEDATKAHSIADAILPIIAANVARERAAVCEEIEAFYDLERVAALARWNGIRTSPEDEGYLAGIEGAERIARSHKEGTK